MPRNTRRVQSDAPIYVSTTSFACEVEGEQYNVRKNERVREGHPLLSAYPDAFERQEDQRVHYEVERATAGPGERRGE